MDKKSSLDSSHHRRDVNGSPSLKGCDAVHFNSTQATSLPNPRTCVASTTSATVQNFSSNQRLVPSADPNDTSPAFVSHVNKPGDSIPLLNQIPNPPSQKTLGPDNCQQELCQPLNSPVYHISQPNTPLHTMAEQQVTTKSRVHNLPNDFHPHPGRSTVKLPPISTLSALMDANPAPHPPPYFTYVTPAESSSLPSLNEIIQMPNPPLFIQPRETVHNSPTNSVSSNTQVSTSNYVPFQETTAANNSGQTDSLSARLKRQCPICGKLCSRPSTLKTHFLIHTGATPFKCPWLNCNKSFNVKSNMLRHYKSHERNEKYR